MVEEAEEAEEVGVELEGTELPGAELEGAAGSTVVPLNVVPMSPNWRRENEDKSAKAHC